MKNSYDKKLEKRLKEGDTIGGHTHEVQYNADKDWFELVRKNGKFAELVGSFDFVCELHHATEQEWHKKNPNYWN